MYKARALEIQQQLAVTTLRWNQSFLGIFLTGLEFRVRHLSKSGERTKMSKWLMKLKDRIRNIMWDKSLKYKSLTVKEKAKSCDELMMMKYMYLDLKSRGILF